MSEIIEIKNLTITYNGRRAVDDLSLNVEKGDIFGFVGPNGAGKTSTIRVMATLLEPRRGDILVGGHSVKNAPTEVQKQIGYMPDIFGVYNDMLVWEYLDFFGACYQIPEDERQTLINDLLELVDLSERRNDDIQRLSQGMKQRLSLARTLLHDPNVLLLDEPASGLDPRARVEIRELLRELAKMGKTIFFSTHILADVTEICTRVAILEEGKLVAYGAIDDLQKQLIPTRKMQVSVLGDGEAAVTLLNKHHLITNVTPFENPTKVGQSEIHFDFSGTEEEKSALLAELVAAKIPVIRFTEDQQNMESVFMRATKGIVS
jgi:ABC-2 type transport system ATP-binding protein